MNTPYARQAGLMRAELVIASATLTALLPHLEVKWQAEEVRELVGKINAALTPPADVPRSTEGV